MRKEIKVGDKVRVSEDAPKIYTEGWSCDWLHAHSNVRKTEGDSAEIELDCCALVIPCKYLVRVGEDRPKTKVSAIEIPVKLDYDESYWQNYEAQLAHDVAVKYAEQGTIDNPALADCVTALARKITEGLKRK